MRVNLVTDTFQTGGGLEHIFQLVKSLADVSFTVFAEGGETFNGIDELDNCEIRSSGYQPHKLLENSPDLIHFHHLRPLARFFRKPWRRVPVPLIFTAHGLHLRKYGYMTGAKARVLFRARFTLEKILLGKVQKVIAVSKDDLSFIENRYNLTNATWLTNGIDFAGFSPNGPDTETLRRNLGLGENKIIFSTIARFNFQKGYDILLRALALEKERLSSAKALFLLVGEGETLPEMKKLAEKLHLNELVKFCGRRDDVYEILQASDFMLLPSRWEGLPIAILEAGFLKVPVIASNTCGNRELLEGSRGLLFENLSEKDLAAKLLMAVEETSGPGVRAEELHREIIASYSIAKMADGLRDIYGELAGSGRET
jgi:glycosyltransferase involved in cell wall biosynthesis